jgi:hypothetical protein
MNSKIADVSDGLQNISITNSTKLSVITTENKNNNVTKSDTKKIRIKIKNNLSIKNILLIDDYESDECINILVFTTKNKLIKHNSSEKYWKFFRNRWVKCLYNEGVSLMSEFFEAYLSSFIYDDDVSSDDKKKLKNRIGKWKKSTPDKFKIFDKLMQKLLVDDKYLSDNDIDINGEQKVVEDGSYLNFEIAAESEKKSETGKESLDDIVKKFICEKILMTKNKDDVMYFKDIYIIFTEWLAANNYPTLNNSMFGRLLKRNVSTYVKISDNSYYTNISIKK